VAELIAKNVCADVLPLDVGGISLTEVIEEKVTVIAPYKGQHKAVSDLLQQTHGLVLPAVNRTSGKDSGRAIWFSQGQWVVLGPELGPKLAKIAAVVDQSDAWAIVRLEGADAEDVLARLVPVNLRRSAFKRGHTLRSNLYHIMASITRIGNNTFQIMVFRSMAETLVHDLSVAMKSVAARQGRG